MLRIQREESYLQEDEWFLLEKDHSVWILKHEFYFSS